MSTESSDRPAMGDVVLHEELTLVETHDPLLMVEILADSRLRSHVVTQLTPCVAVVRSGAAANFVQALVKAGHTPKVSGS